METYHPVVNKIIQILEKNHVWFETFEHEPVRTSEEASKVRSGYTLRQGAKAIIVRIKKLNSEKNFLMLVLPGGERFEEKKVKELLQAKDIRFATLEEVSKITGGIVPGGVPPFGNLFGLNVLVDSELFQEDKIVFNAGDRRFSIAMKSSDYKVLVSPNIENIISKREI